MLLRLSGHSLNCAYSPVGLCDAAMVDEANTSAINTPVTPAVPSFLIFTVPPIVALSDPTTRKQEEAPPHCGDASSPATTNGTRKELFARFHRFGLRVLKFSFKDCRVRA